MLFSFVTVLEDQAADEGGCVVDVDFVALCHCAPAGLGDQPDGVSVGEAETKCLRHHSMPEKKFFQGNL